MHDLIDEIERLCRRHYSPASNAGAHALAAKVIELIEKRLGPAVTLPRPRESVERVVGVQER